MKRTLIRWSMVLTAVGTAGITACAAKDDSVGQQEPAKDLGRVEFKLTATTPEGVTYRLRDAAIMIQGPEDTLFFDTEENLDREVWRANVPPGDYTYFIQEGWRMERLGEHAEANVGAELTSPNPGAFHVESQTTVAVPLRFRVGEHVMADGAFEVSIEVTEEGGHHENTFCTSDEQCGTGETCCSGGFLGTCLNIGDSGSCPLPDLIVIADTAAQSVYISRETFGVNSCALAEECVNGPGERRLLKFATETANIGPMDVILGNPSEDLGFEFSECHSHFHFEGYAAYELKNEAGEVVATGHKQAFCLLDSNQVEGNRPGQFHCGFQGITSGWSDVYGAGLDCQWVDITDVPNGNYLLSISINPERTIPESNYDNNVVEIPVNVGSEAGVTDACPLRGVNRNCGWSVEEDYTSVACEPGALVTASCGCSCSGDPVLRACADAAGCTFSSALATSDDACNLCSEATFVCPESGQFTLLTGSYYGSGEPYTCNLEVSANGGSGPVDVDAGP